MEWRDDLKFYHLPEVKTLPTAIEIFINAMKSKTILSNETFTEYRNQSIRYQGSQSRKKMENLLINLLERKQSQLNILITGGSISGGLLQNVSIFLSLFFFFF